MKNPEITFSKVAYIPTPMSILTVLQQHFGLDENGEVHIGGVALEEFEDDDEQTEQFVKFVVKKAGSCDIIFHRF